MRPNELEPYLGFALDYPVAGDEVRRRLGLVEVTAPGVDATTTIGDLLAPADDASFDSATALYEHLVCNLDERHVGRKFYDDRGGQAASTDGPRDEHNVSF
ncbi:hypothetical protein [Haloarchaeobius salinus]|uniref:DUF5789 family protein n=1 Tax=Haloarchaeobius salinus TaxID=1198298 RepID=UPI00210E3EE4|nr:hypothetical protein [Haloarchaeobius salinus]